MPPELMVPLPRETRISSAGIATAIVSTLFLTAAAAFIGWACFHMVQMNRQVQELRTNGRDAVAQIQQLWRSARSATRNVRYTFPANGVTVTGESTVPNDLWMRMQKSTPLYIRYLPSDPTINHPAAWEDSPYATWPAFFVPVTLLLFGVLFLRQLRLQEQLVSEGLAAPAQIMKISRGSKKGWAISYEFRTLDGRIAAGRAWINKQQDVGSTICVLYLSGNPRRSLPYPLACYRVPNALR